MSDSSLGSSWGSSLVAYLSDLPPQRSIIDPDRFAMDDPQKTAPGDLDARVEKLVKLTEKLTKQEIKLTMSELVPVYARMVIAAEEVVAHRGQLLQETRRMVIAVAANEHDIHEQDEHNAKAAYAAARKAQREIHNSAIGIAGRLTKFEAVTNPRYSMLPVDVAAKFPLSGLMAAIRTLKDFAVATTPHPKNLAEVRFAKDAMSLTKESHSLQWWRLNVEDYPGKWRDMHQLARCWHLTDAKDLAAFQRTIRRLVPRAVADGRTWILPCPPWAAAKHYPLKMF